MIDLALYVLPALISGAIGWFAHIEYLKRGKK